MMREIERETIVSRDQKCLLLSLGIRGHLMKNLTFELVLEREKGWMEHEMRWDLRKGVGFFIMYSPLLVFEEVSTFSVKTDYMLGSIYY